MHACRTLRKAGLTVKRTILQHLELAATESTSSREENIGWCKYLGQHISRLYQREHSMHGKGPTIRDIPCKHEIKNVAAQFVGCSSLAVTLSGRTQPSSASANLRE